MQTRHVYFGGFQHELGEKHPVEALPQLREQPELRAHILNGGFRHYRKSAHGPAELAYRCVRKLLDARPEPAGRHRPGHLRDPYAEGPGLL